MRRSSISTGLAVGSLVLGAALVLGADSGARALTNASGTVYHDENQNGVRDRGEQGIADVVVQSGSKITTTDSGGNWSMNVVTGRVIALRTGWYRTTCDAPSCSPGPGVDQDFASRYQNLRVKARGSVARYDAGLVPDWPGGYPMPTSAEREEHGTDVSVRVSFLRPRGEAGDSNCYRTTTVKHRACAIGDRPVFRVQIFNEGTFDVVNPAGDLHLPAGTRFASLVGAPGNHPRLGIPAVGVAEPTLGTIPFSITGTLPAAAVGYYDLTLVVEAGAPLTTSFQTKGSYPNPVGARITSVDDVDGDNCGAGLVCAWGVTNRQVFPDNSDTVGFAIVPGDEGVADQAPAPTSPATTTIPVVTLPATTTPTTVAPPTTTTTPTTIPVVTLPPATTTPTTVAPPPPPPTTTVPPPSGECTVSSILVPSCGVWLGSSTPSRSSGGVGEGLAQYEQVAENTPDILHFYKTGAKKFPTSTERSLAERPGKQRSLMLFNWKPKDVTWREAAAGRADDQIATVAAGLKAYPHKVFLNIFHEPEDNVRTATSSGMTVADYKAMYRHVVDELRSHGVKNAVYVWNPMGFYGWSEYLDGLYPGHEYVDWVCYDPYAKDDHKKNLEDIINKPRPGIDWPGFYTWATAKAPGKPLMFCEWGVDTLTNSDPASILAGDAAKTLAEYPMLKALVYWNSIDKVNARIDNTSSKGIAYGAAYRKFANQHVFNAMRPNAAP